MVCHVVGRAVAGQSEGSGRTEGSHFLHWLPVRSSILSNGYCTGRFIKNMIKKTRVFFCSSPFTPGLIVIFIVSRGFVGCDKLCHKQSWKDATLKKQVLLLMVQKLSHHPWECFKPSAECDSPQVSNHYNCTFHAAIHVMISEYLYTDNKPLSSSFCCPSKAYRRTKRSVTSWKASGRYGWAGVYSSSACCYSSSCSHYH